SFDLGTNRKNLAAGFDYTLVPGLTLNVSARDEQRDGTRPLGFGTYIRRQALANTPGTGAGQFWRETVEARGVELIEPLQYDTTEYAATLTWAQNGNSASAGVFASEFRNDVTSLYFDNPFEGGPGRASAIVFDPKPEQEPAAPNGNNTLRGLTARSSMQLAPNNDYQRIFGTLSLKLPASTRLNATVAVGTMEQDDPFMPYATNPLVVFSGKHGEPGVVYAADAPLPQDSLSGEMNTTQGDIRLTTRVSRAVNLRAGFRYYQLEDERPSILFPGFSSSGDSYFRPGIGQRDANGNRILYNQIGGYTRERINVGAAWRIGSITLDGEATRTGQDYEERQVESTTDDSFRASVRVPVGAASINAYYLVANRDFDGAYHVGLEASGVRAYDVWKRDRNQFGADFEMPIGDNVVAGFGASYMKDEYPGAVEGFSYGWGLQDSSSASVYAMANYSTDQITLGASAGVDRYDINSLQVTKTGLKADYDPTNRWTRESEDDVVWVSLEALIPISDDIRWNTAADFQRFTGSWDTTNLGTPDVNSAVAYDYPELSDDTLSLRTSLLWEMSSRWGFEIRYLYEPYDLDDFTTDIMSPYMQGSLDETRSNPSDVGAMNVSRFLFLDSRTTDYDASVASALIHFSY
ncbi:MAG: MtrB/PioB family outer membrane beta-barrel protein, partial [Thermoanaerobaculia bacterium]